MIFFPEGEVEFDFCEPNCPRDQPVDNGPATLCSRLKIEACHYFCFRKFGQHFVEPDKRAQGLGDVPLANCHEGFREKSEEALRWPSPK